MKPKAKIRNVTYVTSATKMKSKTTTTKEKGYLDMEPACLSCGLKLRPAVECKNFVTGMWDEHSYLPCPKCFKGNKRLVISIG